MEDFRSLPLAESPYPLAQPHLHPYSPSHARTDPQPATATAYAALMAHLDTLPALENQVLHSVYFDRRSLRQTAELLELPIELVAAAMSRALRAIGRLLDAPVRGGPEADAGEFTG
jgi:DNA-directed RNA polymerase specialized sigma24 family protein